MPGGYNLLQFLKAQVASLTATIVDFGLYGFLHYVCGVWYLAASIAGTIAGGIFSFSMGRQWVFTKGIKRARIQAVRYVLVWSGSLLLNAGGVYFLKEVLHADPTVSKVLVSLLVGFTYNFFLQKHFVFK